MSEKYQTPSLEEEINAVSKNLINLGDSMRSFLIYFNKNVEVQNEVIVYAYDLQEKLGYEMVSYVLPKAHEFWNNLSNDAKRKAEKSIERAVNRRDVTLADIVHVNLLIEQIKSGQQISSQIRHRLIWADILSWGISLKKLVE